MTEIGRQDVIIVGAGPTGLACGIELKKRGVNALLIDKGCVVNSLYHYPTNMVFFTTPELLEIGGIPMTSLNEKPNRIEALKYYRRVTEYYELRVQPYEKVLGIEGEDGAFTVNTVDRLHTARQYSCRKVILAMGYYDIPNRLNVPGADLDKVFYYYKEPHPYFNLDVAVIGGKNSAAITALELYWTRARVTLIHRGGAMSGSVKYWIKPNIENRIKSGEIKGYLNSSVEEIGAGFLVVRTPAGKITIRNDFVFAMIGYRPDFEFMAAHGISLDPATQKPRTNPITLESDRKGMFLAGVIVAGVHTNEIFIENGRFHGAMIADAIASALT